MKRETLTVNILKNLAGRVIICVRRGKNRIAEKRKVPPRYEVKKGVRPVLIVQNDVGNRFSPTVIAAAITSQTEKSHLPTHIYVQSVECGLHKDSVVLLEQIRTLDKRRLKECMGRLEDSTMDKVDHAISISFGLGQNDQDIRRTN